MKYYIKTLRSNLDNILSSESISPYSFYQGRAFGYRRFDRLKEDIFDNVLRVDTEIYDDPEDVIYIELSGEDPQIKNLVPKEKSGGFCVYKTIYLYPWNCRVLFKTADDARSSVFMCRSSLTNKMWGYYSIGVAEKKVKDSKVILKPNDDAIHSREEIEFDNKMNRLKGFLFGYYAGLSKSLSPELAKMLQAEMRLYGLATAVAGMSNPSSETINEIDRLKKIFNASDPNQTKLKHLWNEKVIDCFSTPLDGELFEKFLGKFGVQKTAMYAFAAEQGIAVSPRLESSKMRGADWRIFAQQIDDYTRRVMDDALPEAVATDEERVCMKGGTVKIQQMSGTLYEDVVNEIVGGKTWLSTERVSSKRLDVANDLTYRLKEYDEKRGFIWEGCDHQLYMDRARQNIAYSMSFDPNQTNDKGLRALVVYVLKGDMVDELIKYVQYAGVEDYSLVYGLWGANIGYANLPKTFVNKVGLTVKKTNECYMEVCKALTGLNVAPTLDSNQFTSTVDYLVASSIKPQWVKKSIQEKKNSGAGLQEAIEKLKENPIRLTETQLLEIRSIFDNNGWVINEQAFKLIGKIKGIGKKKLIQIREALKLWIEDSNDILLFNEPNTEVSKPEISITTSDIMRVIKDCLPEDVAVRSQVEKDIFWYLGGRSVISPNMIPKLCQYLKRNKEGSGRRSVWVRKLYAGVDVLQIEKRLVETYL